MIDIFDIKPIDLTNIVCHSGGAEGSDTAWEKIGEKFGVKTRAYSYKTPKHQSPNKVEISDEDYQEGILKVKQANLTLKRWGIEKYMNMLARNWTQVKYSDQIIAIGVIVDPGKRGPKGYYSKSSTQIVDGGTGYATQMAIDEGKPVYIFDQIQEQWFRWSYTTNTFIKCGTPKLISNNFAGIGTREINKSGIAAIDEFFSFNFPTKS